jgi:hypothetical protein
LVIKIKGHRDQAPFIPKRGSFLDYVFAESN